jgi:predicted nucleic acid-binding protein
MRRVFADTYYWIALLNDRDQGHAAAEAISLTLQQATLITTQEVLSEVLTFFCEEGQYVQQAVAAYVGYGNDSRQTGPLRVPPSLQQSGRYPGPAHTNVLIQ